MSQHLEELEGADDRFVADEVSKLIDSTDALVDAQKSDAKLAGLVGDLVATFKDRLGWNDDATQMEEFRRTSIQLEQALFNHAERKLREKKETASERRAEEADMARAA